MRKWPSIVPDSSEDFYLVLNHYGRHGTVFAETDLDRANYETTLRSGNPARRLNLEGICRQSWKTH